VNEDLKQALDESLPDDVVAASLAGTLGEVRRKRRQRQGVTLAGMAVAIVASIVVWSWQATPFAPGPAAGQMVNSDEGLPRLRIREISDAELLALFPGRAAGFATVNGNREFILLPPEGTEGDLGAPQLEQR